MGKNKQFTVPITVPLDQIRISERRRRGLSVSTVERYRQWLEQGREAPPVRLVRLGDGFAVQDGRHRVAAAQAAGQLEIDAEVAALARLRARAMSTICRLWRRTARAAESFQPLGLPSTGNAPSTWGRSSGGRAPRLQRGDVGSTPTVSISVNASVVSTASTRPLYGRGAGSTPAGGFTART
jgi:hypothetical protein